MSIDGILVVNKAAGMTSHDVVGRVRRAAGAKRVGHAGTLDPDATGVLIVCIGSATRLAEYLVDSGKRYRTLCRLGAATSTEDASGKVLSRTDASHITEAALRAVLPRFTGDILQIPPMVSAVHHNGKRLYEIARSGETVVREPRPIRIDSLQLIDFQSSSEPSATLEVQCGKGAYIRTLCADIGESLGVGGFMETLVRTAVGPYGIEEALDVEKITRETIEQKIVPSSSALPWMSALRLSADEETAVSQGKTVDRDGPDEEALCLVTDEGRLAAIASRKTGIVHPFKVFPPEPA